MKFYERWENLRRWEILWKKIDIKDENLWKELQKLKFDKKDQIENFEKYNN